MLVVILPRIIRAFGCSHEWEARSLASGLTGPELAASSARHRATIPVRAPQRCASPLKGSCGNITLLLWYLQHRLPGALPRRWIALSPWPVTGGQLSVSPAPPACADACCARPVPITAPPTMTQHSRSWLYHTLRSVQSEPPSAPAQSSYSSFSHSPYHPPPQLGLFLLWFQSLHRVPIVPVQPFHAHSVLILAGLNAFGLLTPCRGHVTLRDDET